MKKVIVQIVQHLETGGIECMVLEFKRLLDENHEVHIISLEGNNGQDSRLWPRIKELTDNIHYFNKKPGLQPNLVFKLKNLLKQLNVDIVHTHHIGPLIYGGIAARWAKVPVVIHTEHDAWHLNALKRRFIQRHVLKYVKPILVADAQMVASAMCRAIPGIKPYVITNGVNLVKFTPGDKLKARETIGLPARNKIIGCAARLVPEKAHHNLLLAFSQLPIDVHLALAGDGPLKPYLEKLCADLCITDRVHFLGNVDAITTFYQAIDVFVLASKHEGMPLSPLEAQACNIPVVLTDVGGNREIVCPVTGKLVTVDNNEELALALTEQLQNERIISPRVYVESCADLRSTVSSYLQLALTKTDRVNNYV